MALTTPDTGKQSTIENLQEALREYNSVLTDTRFKEQLWVEPCRNIPISPQQVESGALIQQLKHYETCAVQLAAVSPGQDKLCKAVELNMDLLVHLGHLTSLAYCPSRLSPSSPGRDKASILAYLQCVDCWSQQVAALRR